jgi:hypothetical protein
MYCNYLPCLLTKIWYAGLCRSPMLTRLVLFTVRIFINLSIKKSGNNYCVSCWQWLNNYKEFEGHHFFLISLFVTCMLTSVYMHKVWCTKFILLCWFCEYLLRQKTFVENSVINGIPEWLIWFKTITLVFHFNYSSQYKFQMCMRCILRNLSKLLIISLNCMLY